MDFIRLWRDDRALSKILCSTIPIPVHDLKIKITDFEFFCVKSLQCQLLQSLWLIWIVFGRNGYKILKYFRKEKRVSGELPCPATGLIDIKPLKNVWAGAWQNLQNHITYDLWTQISLHIHAVWSVLFSLEMLRIGKLPQLGVGACHFNPHCRISAFLPYIYVYFCDKIIKIN